MLVVILTVSLNLHIRAAQTTGQTIQLEKKAFTYPTHKKAIMDFEQTALIYKNFGHEKKFQEKPEYFRYNKEKAWYEKVKSKRTGEYYQADELIKRELVPEGWKPPHVDSKGKPVKYPIKHVSEIIRKRLVDGSEWLLSRD